MKKHLNEWIESIIPWLLSSGTRILLIVLVSFVAYYILKKIIARLVKVAVLPTEPGDTIGEEQREQTLTQIFTIALKIIICIISGLMIAAEFGVKIAPLLASAGVVGLALGFGGQYLIKDIISGLFIILENQYRIDDFIEVAGLSGKVEKITLRVTRLRDLDGNTHHIPHGEIKTVSNLSKTFSRVNIDIGVAYGTNINKVAAIINETGAQLAQDPEWAEKIITAPKFLRVQDLGDSSVVVKILGDTKPSQQWAVSGELRKRIYEAFNNNNVEIPFPQTVIHVAKDKTQTPVEF